MSKYDQYAHIAHGESKPLRPRYLGVEDQGTDGEHKGRAQVDDQPLEICADVLKTAKIQKAREVVAAEAKSRQEPPVTAPQRGPPSACPPREAEEQWQREKHSVRDDRDRIDAVAI